MHRKRPKKPLLAVDLANLPGTNPEVEEANEGDISETDEDGSSAVKIKTCETFSDHEDDSLDVASAVLINNAVSEKGAEETKEDLLIGKN